MKNRFAALQDTTLTNSAKTKYNHFELACKETAADTIPLKPKIKKRTPWETEEICQKRKHLHEAAQVWKIDDFHQVLLDFCNNVHNQDPINRWRKGCLLPIPKKGNLAITKNYRGITLTAIPAKIYNLMLLNRIRPKIDPVLRKNQNGFRTNRSTKNLPATLLFIDFPKAFDSIHRGKMKEILSAYGIPKETVDAIMIMYQDTQSMVRSPDGDTDFFDISAGVLQGDTLAPYIFIICLDYVLRKALDKNNELGFTLTKQKSKCYPAMKITDADYADDLAVLADILKDATFLLHSIERTAKEIGLYLNADKTEFICFNQDASEGMRSLNGEKIKQVDDFKYEKLHHLYQT